MSRAVASRYQPALVALHWIVALMIIGLLCVGFFVLAAMPNADPGKLKVLVPHMAGGMFVLLLMIARLIIRIRSAHPAPATIGSSLLDRLATMAHRGLYLIVFMMIATGWTTGFLIRGAFGPHGRLPTTFDALPTFQAHAALACLLVLLITAHIGAALYHQFARKDGLIGRMWFGKRLVVRAEG